MAPKKAPAKPQDKQKAVEDKTFGMKNKKGGKGQKIIQQVQKNVEAAGGAKRGPSKKEMKEAQKAQEEEMLALFNVVPKKKDELQEAQDMNPDTGPTFTDITQEIEYQRANVVAKTKITEDVFQEWRKKKVAARKAEQEAAKQDRIKRGQLTGWEIFMENNSNIVDDDTAAGDDDMLREIDEEEEIRKMTNLSLQAQRDARTAAGMPDDEDDESAAGPSTSAQAGPSASAAAAAAAPAGRHNGAVTTATGVALSAEDQAALFDDDDSDEDVDLDALERQVQAS